MPFGIDDAILAGLSALSGIFGNRPQEQRTTNTSENFGQSAGTQQSGGVSYSGPEFDFFQDQLRQNLFTKYLDMMNKDPNLSGYRAGQVSNFNRLSDIQKRNSAETLASRGVSGPATATASNQIDSNRFNNIVGLDRDIPLLSRNMNLDLMQKAASLFQTIPGRTVNEFSQSTNTTGTNYGTGTQTQIGTMPGNQLGGGLGNLANMLAFLFGQSANSQNPYQRTSVTPMQ